MTKQEALQFVEKWKLSNEMRVDAVRLMSPSQKLRALGALFNFAQQLGWTNTQEEDQARPAGEY